jgi:hypothetical protein
LGVLSAGTENNHVKAAQGNNKVRTGGLGNIRNWLSATEAQCLLHVPPALKIKVSEFFRQSSWISFLPFSEQAAFMSLASFSQLVFRMGTKLVLCETGIAFLILFRWISEFRLLTYWLDVSTIRKALRCPTRSRSSCVFLSRRVSDELVLKLKFELHVRNADFKISFSCSYPQFRRNAAIPILKSNFRSNAAETLFSYFPLLLTWSSPLTNAVSTSVSNASSSL